MSRINQLRHRLPLKAIIPILLISTLCIVSFASKVSVTSETYKAVTGVSYVVSGDFQIESLGFSVAPNSYVMRNTWGSFEPLSNGVEAGNWIYSFKLIPGESATLPVEVTLTWSREGNIYEPMGEPIQVRGSFDDIPEQICVVDVGDNFDSPVMILITVA